MIIADYFQAFQQTQFSSEADKRRIISAFSDALAHYGGSSSFVRQDPKERAELRSFFFALPPAEESDMAAADQLTITDINKEVLENQLERLFAENGISMQHEVVFKIDKFGQLVAREHPQADKIMQLLGENPALAARVQSSLRDASIAGHEAHLEMIDLLAQKEGYGPATKKALLREKERAVAPPTQLRFKGGEMQVQYNNSTLKDWLSVQHVLLKTLIAEFEAKRLAPLLAAAD